MSMTKENVAAFLIAMQPAIEAERRFYAELPLGTKIWKPCSGITGIAESGHVGRVDTYLGNKNWQQGDWTTQTVAEEQGARITSSHGMCPECYAIVKAHISHEKTD